MFDVVGVLVLVILWLVFAFLVRGSWHARTAILRWLGVIVASLLTIILTLAIIIVLVGFYKLSSAPATQASAIKVQGTPDQLARGQKLANFCSGCHSTANKFPLDGAVANFLKGGGSSVGVVQPPNLTPAGPLAGWSDGEVIRAVRDGVDKNGRPLIIMPSETFHNMSDTDVQSLVAYLRSQPPAPHDTAPTQLNALGALFVGLGFFKPTNQPPITAPVTNPPPGPTVEYGKYVVSIAGCQVCHGSDLGGGVVSQFGPVPGPNLTVLVPKMTATEFLNTIRSGVDPSGHKLDPDKMPWREISDAFDDSELTGANNYIRTLPPVNRLTPAK